MAKTKEETTTFSRRETNSPSGTKKTKREEKKSLFLV
jgi:hypothetical protein